MFILPVMQKPTIPTKWTFFGKKETLEKSNEPSLIKVRGLAHFLFSCSRKQLSITVYVVLSPIVEYDVK